jgi:CheY-like chemotaxis protein
MGNKILVADDSVTIQKIVELTFEGEGFDLEVVSDGQEALARAEASPPDIILADLTMPGLSGLELCRKIREHPRLRSIPFILLTNSFEEFDRGEGDAAGVTAYVEKPFESQALIDRVQELIGKEVTYRPPEERRPPADDVDLISEGVEEEPTPPDLQAVEKPTAEAPDLDEAEEVLLLEEIVEEPEEPAPTEVQEPTLEESPAAEPPTSQEEPEVTEETAPSEAFISMMDATVSALGETGEEEPEEEMEAPSPKPEEVAEPTPLSGMALEEAVGGAVRAYIDELVRKAIEELTPSLTEKVVERLQSDFPSIAERVIRDEIEKLKRGE